MVEPNTLAAAVIARDRRALAKAITLVESARDDHRELAERLLELVQPESGRALRLGVSGVPGAGKSTFIEALGLYLIEHGRRVAVLAVDPSSAVSGGSILGDKTRMPRLGSAPEAFVRPSPSGGALGGVARRTREAMLVCEAAGYDVVIVETVGVGQSEHAVAGIVDTFLLLALAGAGDELQGIKRGILELCDVVAVNKADGDNRTRAENAARQYTGALRLLRGDDPGWAPRVLTLSALEGHGLAELWSAVEEHRRWLEESGELVRRRGARQRAWLWELVHEGLEAELRKSSGIRALAPAIERAVEAGTSTPTEGARRLLALFAERH